MIDPRQARERTLELLADQAVFGLSPEEKLELDNLASSIPVDEREALDSLAADLARSGLPEIFEPMPTHLLAKVVADSQQQMTPVPSEPISNRSSNSRSLGTWLALAAAILVGLFFWWQSRTPLQSSNSERRNELLARQGQPGSDVLRLNWTATADPAGQGASGDVVWSTAAQEGYMLFRGLAANTPAVNQYQLWVFDAERDERYPVDGGVFNVPQGQSEVVVPIRVKLNVSKPVLFAVTVEPPGGVVVSSRSRLPLLAKVPEAGKG